MDKVQKHKSFNTNTPSSESYRNEKQLNYVSRLGDIIYSKQLLEFRPIERRRPGWPLKRLQEGYNHREEKGHSLA
jgi:hypothetical protein